MSQTKLEQIAIQQRQNLIAKNTYDTNAPANGYGATHTRALSDSLTPNFGKGTGTFMDVQNGGSDIDINGNPNIGGSGRKGNTIINQFNDINGYTHPDTSLNKGQIII